MKNNEIIWSRAPLRLGLAGGGTDVAPYSDIHVGRVLNSTINLYAYANIEPRSDDKIIFESFDLGIKEEFSNADLLETDGELALLKGVYNRIRSKYSLSPLSFKLSILPLHKSSLKFKIFFLLPKKVKQIINE